ncbi:MAG: formate/nitrite transporter family protein [Clostridiales bacterium]|nr:formate/nitrite transporter family protein [Clostridiales bacterium]
MIQKFNRGKFNDFIHFLFMTLLSGAMIAICATSSLTASVLSQDGRIVGALLFSLGMFVILAFEMKLFTGLIPKIPHTSPKSYWQLPVCLLGNLIGVYIVYLLVSQTYFADKIIMAGSSLISNKLSLDNWALSSVSSGVLCGILITLSVLSVDHSHKKGLSANVGVMFPIIVFVFCGFDHSIANMFYFYCLGEFSWKVIGYIALTILGNLIGGIILPLVLKLRDNDPV